MKIEIGENLLEGIKVIDKNIRDIGGGAIGDEIKTAFGIDVEKIMQVGKEKEERLCDECKKFKVVKIWTNELWLKATDEIISRDKIIVTYKLLECIVCGNQKLEIVKVEDYIKEPI